MHRSRKPPFFLFSLTVDLRIFKHNMLRDGSRSEAFTKALPHQPDAPTGSGIYGNNHDTLKSLINAWDKYVVHSALQTYAHGDVVLLVVSAP
jgi:hypothetical protein